MKVFFTFGSDDHFPYGPNDYVEVEAPTGAEACRLFQALHPNRPGSGCLNCAFYYTEESFNTFRDKYYKGVEPIETITVRRA